MKTCFLRFADEAAACVAFAAVGRPVESFAELPTKLEFAAGFVDVDPIGAIDGAVGFHVNLGLPEAATLAPALAAAEIFPATPVRAFA